MCLIDRCRASALPDAPRRSTSDCLRQGSHRCSSEENTERLNPFLNQLLNIKSIMSSYTSEYPSVPFDPAFKKFFEDFYAISDDPNAHDTYVQQFTKDATLIMASKTGQGSEGNLLP